MHNDHHNATDTLVFASTVVISAVFVCLFIAIADGKRVKAELENEYLSDVAYYSELCTFTSLNEGTPSDYYPPKD